MTETMNFSFVLGPVDFTQFLLLMALSFFSFSLLACFVGCFLVFLLPVGTRAFNG